MYKTDWIILISKKKYFFIFLIKNQKRWIPRGLKIYQLWFRPLYHLHNIWSFIYIYDIPVYIMHQKVVMYRHCSSLSQHCINAPRWCSLRDPSRTRPHTRSNRSICFARACESRGGSARLWESTLHKSCPQGGENERVQSYVGPSQWESHALAHTCIWMVMFSPLSGHCDGMEKLWSNAPKQNTKMHVWINITEHAHAHILNTTHTQATTHCVWVDKT